MDKYQEKNNAKFRSIYGNSLILNMRTSNACLQISLKNKSRAFFHKSRALILCICAIAVIMNMLDINICLVILSLTFFLTLFYKSLFFISEEEVLIIKGFGCQISKKSLLGQSTMFIPYERIQKVFINEVIFRQRVIYLLTLLTKGSHKEGEGEDVPKLVPLFMNLLPKIDCLEIIYKNVKYLDGR